PLRVGYGGGAESCFQGQISEAWVFNRRLSGDEPGIVATVDSVRSILKTPRNQRSDGQMKKLSAYYLANVAPVPEQRAYQKRTNPQRDYEAFAESFSTVMVMEEMSPPRETHLLIRGEYDKPGEKVLPGVPASLHALPSGANNNRLAFAQWLVAP